MDPAERLIEFLQKGKTWFVPEVVVRPEAVMEAFARAIADPAQSTGEENSDHAQSLWDSLLLDTAVHTKELCPSDHYNLIVVAMDYMVRSPDGCFAPEDAEFLLYTMLRYLPELSTFDPHFRHRGAAALSLLLYRDVGLIRLDPESHFVITFLLMHHCRAAMRDMPERTENCRKKVSVGESVSEASLKKRWGFWFGDVRIDSGSFDRLLADMMVWHKRLVEDSGHL